MYAFDVCKFRDDSTSRLGDIRCRDFNRLFDDFLQFVEIVEFRSVLLLFSRSGRLLTATMDQPGSERDSVGSVSKSIVISVKIILCQCEGMFVDMLQFDQKSS